MVPLVSDVYSGVRSVLGDTLNATGEVFTDALLEPHYQSAYSELFRALDSAQSPRLEQETYFDLPAYSGYLDPAFANISNLGELTSIEERGGVTSWAISAATPGAGLCTLTNAASTLATGNQGIVYGIVGLTDDVNGIWTVTVNSTTSTQLNGCTATGTYVSGGVLSYSTEPFLELGIARDIDWAGQAPGDSLRVYAYERGIFRFPPANSIRQLRIRYMLSGDAPTATTASTGIDDCLDFLKYRIAGAAGPSKGMLTRAQIYTNRAVGPRWDVDGTPGGILKQMLDESVRNLQRLPPAMRRSPAFGVRRSRRWMAW